MEAMRRTRILFAAFTLTALTVLAPAQSAPQLSAVLSQMDAASAKFQSAQADVRYDIYTRVVRDHSIQTDSIYVARKGAVYTMGAVVYNAGPDGKPAKPAANVIQFDGGALRSYVPSDNQVNVFKAGASQAKYQTFLTLGFGGSGKELANAWTITDQGPETIAGTRTEKLDLVGKTDDIKNLFTHVTIWVDPTRSISLRQIFYTSNGDNRTADYTNIKLNAHVDTKPYDIPKGAKSINR
jgi:outer membrane lipoprotein-sorting protein